MSEQEMIERYIYEVIRRVPLEAREEIRMEISALIEDMQGGEDLSVQAVLEKLGDPAVFARRYREDKDYLIGPEYYDDYVWILKLVLIGVGISAVVSALINGFMGMENWQVSGWVSLFVNFFVEFFENAFGGVLGAVGMVTGIFAFLEWRKVKVKVKPEKSWTPFSLPKIPDKRALIEHGDSIASIIFISIFAALLLFVPELFGAFHYEDGNFESIACVFNLEAWGSILPVFILCLAAGLVNEIIRLAMGRYCRGVMYSTIICNIIQLAGAGLLFFVFPLWNPDFALQIRQMAGIEKFSRGDLLAYWNTEGINRVLFLIILVCSLLEVGVAVYKTFKYEGEGTEGRL